MTVLELEKKKKKQQLVQRTQILDGFAISYLEKNYAGKKGQVLFCYLLFI